MDNQVQNHWSLILLILEKELTDVVYNTNIKPLVPLYIEDGMFVIKSNSEFFKKTVVTRYMNVITNAVRQVTNTNLNVKIVTDKDLVNNPAKKNINEELYSKTNVNSKYHFDSFVRGKSNELAYAAATAISEAPGKTTYNPLFMYGGVGLGKTHLMHAIGNHILEQNPDTKVLYCSTETFTNELINSIKERKNQEFRNKYREIDVLLIDDIQFLSDKEGTQEEFFHTFNTLYAANKQIVISSDQPPKEIKTLEDRLRSRFACGLIVDITLPDFETRCAIIEKKAENDNFALPKEITDFIARNIVSNIRDIEGALNKVTAWTSINSTPITLVSAQEALKDLLTGQERPEITVEYIQEIVASYFKITVEEITSKRRTQNITYPRQIAMYLSRKLLDMSLPKIGIIFGGRDHSTIIHGSEKILNEIESDVKLKNTLIELERLIKGE